jgi:hypothetical protein
MKRFRGLLELTSCRRYMELQYSVGVQSYIDSNKPESFTIRYEVLKRVFSRAKNLIFLLPGDDVGDLGYIIERIEYPTLIKLGFNNGKGWQNKFGEEVFCRQFAIVGISEFRLEWEGFLDIAEGEICYQPVIQVESVFGPSGSYNLQSKLMKQMFACFVCDSMPTAKWVKITENIVAKDTNESTVLCLFDELISHLCSGVIS